ncbi:MAG TPA: hypothetical protein VFG04_12270 [Planctomycetaceae bacterium]|jgi:hypothetical protein|nr:hypothetical protein [Planctomycetaceae bacterium]
MHIFITAVLILAYGLLLIFGLLHVLQSLIARPTPWLRMALEAAEEGQDKGGNAHARNE